MHLQQAEGGGEVVHLQHRLVRVPQRELGRRRHVERVVLARVVDVVRHSCDVAHRPRVEQVRVVQLTDRIHHLYRRSTRHYEIALVQCEHKL